MPPTPETGLGARVVVARSVLYVGHYYTAIAAPLVPRPTSHEVTIEVTELLHFDTRELFISQLNGSSPQPELRRKLGQRNDPGPILRTIFRQVDLVLAVRDGSQGTPEDQAVRQKYDSASIDAEEVFPAGGNAVRVFEG